QLVAAWREATVFTEAERAALELTEQGTRIADAAGGVGDAAWANAARHYDEDQLVALISLIAVINAYNRINVINRQPAGDYRPGQFGWPRAGRPPARVPLTERWSGLRALRQPPAGADEVAGVAVRVALQVVLVL